MSVIINLGDQVAVNFKLNNLYKNI